MTLHICHCCKSPVVTQQGGRISYRGTDIGEYPDTGKVTGVCPRPKCGTKWEFMPNKSDSANSFVMASKSTGRRTC